MKQKLMILSLTLIMLSISACATMNQRVFKEIHKGDSEEHVTQVLGQPDTFEPLENHPGVTFWAYMKDGYTCGFGLLDSKVVSMNCSKNKVIESSGSVLGAAISGMGQGLQQSRGTNCQTIYTRGYATTSCQ